MLRTLIMALLATAVHPASASPGGQAVLDPLMLAIAAWVSEATDLPLPRTLPAVRFAAPEEMGRLMRAAVLLPTGEGASEIVAFYDTSGHAIFLPSGWSGATPEASSNASPPSFPPVNRRASGNWGSPSARSG